MCVFVGDRLEFLREGVFLIQTTEMNKGLSIVGVKVWGKSVI